ncbi:TlpA family protein disulfide reductase [Sphingomonas japonica]|uniref:Thiol-disulfide isomerase/thioredoxin n=1 Tax=Sphingomonas japonica TaxID=511662 RepID=A0ABX0U278_9SPHN|nr:TlpA disulfide reductase family protein [Sphingomonas japonica]NIJ23811.1 thiol-disulfide isomerase/thioredoxin [Sphingomonas japonica]
MRSETALLLGVLTLLVGGCDRQSQAPAQGNVASAAPAAADAQGEAVTEEIGMLDRSHAGEPMPTAAFKEPGGSPTALSAFKGKPLLVNLWATWCAPCIKEMPTLDALAAREGDALQVLAVSQDITGPEKVAAYFEQADFARLQPYLDDQAALSVAYAANLPTTVLYDAAGREVWRMTGSMDWTNSSARELLAEAS